ncbi:phenylacetate--CoA ligase family protein [Methanosarcina sp. KYL-1]|uniref:hypothetical protein n=1 Tax=Methanosarcina sp. KYL-1 TaxID=2602068 RepID=UPI0021012EDD|nr:hypothetical protein [Methanosarcina sp. KYL-1]MCQ1536889.1 phenylacetate--CoA ligase family protein [Methanosarcina sp. KYL-1]
MNWRKPLIYTLLYLTGSKIPNILTEIGYVDGLSAEKIKEYQNEKLKNLLIHAYQNVPYYHKVLPEAKVIINGEVHLENFENMPLLTKDIIRKERENLYSHDYAKRKHYKNTSGGSTGEPVTFLQDKQYDEWNISTKIHVNKYLGKDLGNREIKFWGSSRDVIEGTLAYKEKIINYLYNRKFFNSYNLNKENVEKLVYLNNKFRPDAYWSYADSALEFSKIVLDKNIEFHPPKLMITTINPLNDTERNIIENTFKCPVYDEYGSREVGWIACQCKAKGDLHTFPWFNYVEVLDQKNNIVGAEDEGRIIVTSLENYSMPLIRYDIGDVVVSGGYSKCSCGRYVFSLKEIHGRTLGYFKKRDGSLVHSHFIVERLFFKDWIRRFQVIQEDFEDILIRVEKYKEPKNEDFAEISNKVKIIMGENCLVRFEFVDNIKPTESGKYLYTICKVADC